MDQNRKQSSRLWLLVIGILFAILKEVLSHYGVQISTETLVTIESAILATAGLDTLRPLGAGKKPKTTESSDEDED